MNTYRYIHWLIVAVLVLSIPACSPGSSPPPVTDATQSIVSESSPTAEATELSVTEALTTAPPESADACDNPYLPIVAGATWNYKLTGTVSDTFTHTILSVESDRFVEQDQFGTGVTRQGTWQCDNGDLTALNPTTGSSANVSTEGVSVDFETTAQSGVTLPATINPGDTWTQSLTLEGTQTISGISYEASNQFSNGCTAIGIESVTVEAGAFDAMRVECQTDMNISIALDPNNPVSTPLSAKNIYWYAEDIGMVKNTTTGTGIESTIELVSYNIP